MQNQQRPLYVRDILSILEDFAPLSLQESYDNAGLICGNPEAEIHSVLLSTDITEEVIDEAVQGGHDLLISHHPLTIQGLKNLRPDSYVKRCLIKAIRHNLNIYSAHTNLDAVLHGVSGRMADKLGLQNRKILQPGGKLFSLCFYTPVSKAEEVRQAVLGVGGGHIGNYSHCSFNQKGEGTFHAEAGSHPYVGVIGTLHREEEIKTEITVPEYLLSKSIETLLKVHPYEEPVFDFYPLKNTWTQVGSGVIGELEEPETELDFLKRIKKTFEVGCLRHTRLSGRLIQKVALCGGAGAFLLPKAVSADADVFITGEVKYHDYFNYENDILVAEMGHYESEQYTKEIFYSIIQEMFPELEVQITRVNTNPIKYL